jgi:hypothetical protein
MVLLSSTVTETVIERQRWYMVTGWSSNLLFSDPHQWSDIDGNAKTREDFQLPDDHGEEWRWTSDWHVYVNQEETESNAKAKLSKSAGDIEKDETLVGSASALDEYQRSSLEIAFASLTDANGWVYATSFNLAKNWSHIASSGMKVVRMRRWIRTRGKRDLRAELATAHQSPPRKEEFSTEELQLADKLVSKYDTNGDGLLEKTDLLRLLKEEKGLDEALGLKPPVMARQTSADDPTICTICYVGKVNACIIPCGHHVMCMACAQPYVSKESQCPVCRKHVDQCIQTYTS